MADDIAHLQYRQRYITHSVATMSVPFCLQQRAGRLAFQAGKEHDMRKMLFIVAIAGVAAFGLVNAANAFGRDPQGRCILAERVESALAPHVLGLLVLGAADAPATQVAGR